MDEPGTPSEISVASFCLPVSGAALRHSFLHVIRADCSFRESGVGSNGRQALEAGAAHPCYPLGASGLGLSTGGGTRWYSEVPWAQRPPRPKTNPSSSYCSYSRKGRASVALNPSSTSIRLLAPRNLPLQVSCHQRIHVSARLLVGLCSWRENTATRPTHNPCDASHRPTAKHAVQELGLARAEPVTRDTYLSARTGWEHGAVRRRGARRCTAARRQRVASRPTCRVTRCSDAVSTLVAMTPMRRPTLS